MYYVFEHAPRGCLTKMIGKFKDSHMPLELIQYYAAEIILALEYMHNKNILHRDLKPENILITNDWHLKIVKEKKKFIHIF